MKLYTNYPTNFFTQTCLIVADMCRVPVEMVVVSEEDQKAADFQKKKLMQFPFLETDDGEIISECAAISTYFSRCAPASGLYGQSPFQSAKVDEWVAWNQNLWLVSMPAMYAVFGHRMVPQDKFSEYVKSMKTEMMVLNNYLKGKYYLVGDNVTIADVIVASHLIVSFQTVYDGGYRKAIPNVTEWFERISSLPSFVKHCGYVKLADKPFKAFDGSAAPAPAPAAAAEGGKKGKKGKEEKKPEKKDDDVDMDDLFGDDDDDGAAAKAAQEKVKADAKKKKKKVVIAMSLVLLEVKPLDDTTDLDKLAQTIFNSFK